MVADPRKVDPRVYDAIYAVPGGAPGYDRYFQYARHIVRARDPLHYLTTRVDAAWGVYQALSKYRAVSVLEAGCGLGYFTYALKRGGYDVVGIDVSQEAVTKATRAYGDLYKTESIESYARSSEQTFDGVVMVEVIEHLENPVAAIEDAVRLLSPGGVPRPDDAESFLLRLRSNLEHRSAAGASLVVFRGFDQGTRVARGMRLRVRRLQ